MFTYIMKRLCDGLCVSLSLMECLLYSSCSVSCLLIRIDYDIMCTVGGTVREFDVGENGVLSWSPPVPPNGDILYYNVIITRADTGELVIRLEELYVLTIDVSKYGEINMDYNISVRSLRTHVL